MIFFELIDSLLLLPFFAINGILCTLENLFSIIITSVMVWISSISVARISVWVMVASVSISISVGVWMVSSVCVWSYYYGFCGFFLSCLLFHLLFSGLDYWNVVVGVVRISVSVGVWMMVTGISTVVIPGISFGFRLGCCSSKKSENYEKFHGKRCGRFSGRHG